MEGGSTIVYYGIKSALRAKAKSLRLETLRKWRWQRKRREARQIFLRIPRIL